MASEQFTMRMSKELKDKLEQLSKDTGRSKAYLALEAIENYIDYHAWEVKAIKEGIMAADRGELISEEEMWKEFGID